MSFWVTHFPHLLWKQTEAAPASLQDTERNEQLVGDDICPSPNHGDYSHDSCCGERLIAYRSTCKEMATIK